MQFLVVVSMFFMASCDSIYWRFAHCRTLVGIDHNMNNNMQMHWSSRLIQWTYLCLVMTISYFWLKEPNRLHWWGGNRMSLADELSFGSYKILTGQFCPIATGWRLIPGQSPIVNYHSSRDGCRSLSVGRHDRFSISTFLLCLGSAIRPFRH